jgi:predicted DNA-binding antitoxin AbrB/MazE fold protein
MLSLENRPLSWSAEMTETILAIYEEGVLRPLEPLHLKEQQRVYIQVVPEERDESPPEEDRLEALIQRLIREGRIVPRPPGPIPPDPVSEEERLRLADLLGKVPGKPLSEIIIEERGEW